ncbi:MAG TPA: ferritin-like domain-containing protein [Polyangiaceae bacterium]|nr:ferritin-like domain-containing protein [Polyangiaceae bacterium]
MALRTDFRLWHPALLAAAGLLPLACGGSTMGKGEGPADEPIGGVANQGGSAVDGGGRDEGGGTAGTSTVVTTPGGSGGSGGRGTIVIDCSSAVALGNGYEDCDGVLHRVGPAACASGGNCEADADCEAGSQCACSRFGAVCAGGCASDADCPETQLCIYGDVECGTLSAFFACREREIPRIDCSTVGRPFLVAGRAITAQLQEREDWHCAEVAPDVSKLSPPARAALARYWHDAALMEHASIAAFARFVLDLMSLGAAPKLVEDATRAMLDEARHTQACFALANAFAGASFGPSPLSVQGSLDQRSLREIVITAVREGCIGETVAAMEAAEALAHASDPAVRSTLARIVEDELSHAALAFRFVRWAVAHFGDEVRSITDQTFEAELSRAPVRVGASDLAVPSHGLLSAAQRAELRSRVLVELVAPTLPLLMAA